MFLPLSLITWAVKAVMISSCDFVSISGSIQNTDVHIWDPTYRLFILWNYMPGFGKHIYYMNATFICLYTFGPISSHPFCWSCPVTMLKPLKLTTVHIWSLHFRMQLGYLKLCKGRDNYQCNLISQFLVIHHMEN